MAAPSSAGIYLHKSNRSEHLIQQLAKILQVSPQSPFAAEIFLIQSPGMERWIKQSLSMDQQVFAHSHFHFPTKFFNDLAQRLDLSLRSPFYERESLLWSLESILRHSDHADLHSLQAYLQQGNNPDLRRYQLAKVLAQLFDEYQMMRPQWLDAWHQGQLVNLGADEPWQAHLWRQLVEKLGPGHRGAQWQGLMDALGQPQVAGVLPQRVFLFGINALPPLAVAVLQALAAHTQVHLFLLWPQDGYWQDMRSQRAEAKARARLQGDANLAEGVTQNLSQAQHPLLCANIAQLQSMQEVLLPLETGLGFDSFAGHEAPSNLLEWLQNQLLEDDFFPLTAASIPSEYQSPQGQHKTQQNPPQDHQAWWPPGTQGDLFAQGEFAANVQQQFQPLPQDDSIQIHSCHSPQRELEVIREVILQRMADEPHWGWHDWVVMAPNIEDYAPLIGAIFAQIPHSIADRSWRAQDDVLDSFLALLQLSQGRLPWDEVMDFLERPPVQEALHLSETTLEEIPPALEAAAIRWGLDADQLASLSLTQAQVVSWQAGLDRLILGSLMPADAPMLEGVLPLDHLEGSATHILTPLIQLLAWVRTLQTLAREERKLCDWLKELKDFSKEIWHSDTDAGQRLSRFWRQLEESLHLVEALEVPLSFAVVSKSLEDHLQERNASQGFLSGRLTFCSLLPMRAIPLKGIVLLGMNQDAFPRQNPPLAFNLMRQPGQQRPGDRDKRADDRQQFLEILLSARHTLIISYQGQDISSQETQPPSLVVTELLAVLGDGFHARVHPLTAFSPLYFTPTGRSQGLFSSDPMAFDLAKALHQSRESQMPTPSEEPHPWWKTPKVFLPSQDTRSEDATPFVTLDALVSYWKSPQRYFVQNVLGIRLLKDQSAVANHEVFELNQLDTYLWKQAWLEKILQGEDLHSIAESTLASGQWPLGVAGKVKLAKDLDELDIFAQKLQGILFQAGASQGAEKFELGLDGYRLGGQIQRHKAGYVQYRPASLKEKDRVEFWLKHLVICALTSGDLAPSQLISMEKDGDKCYKAPKLDSDQAKALLVPWVEGYLYGQNHLSHWLPDLMDAYRKPKIDEERAQTLAKALNEKLFSKRDNVKSEAEWPLLFSDQTRAHLNIQAFEQTAKTLASQYAEYLL